MQQGRKMWREGKMLERTIFAVKIRGGRGRGREWRSPNGERREHEREVPPL